MIGTRPEAIKMAPVILRMKSFSSKIKTIVCSTGQHDKLLKQALDFFNISLDVNLDLSLENDTLDQFFSRALISTTKLFKDLCPELILVHGDTSTAHASAQAAYYLKIPIAHIEAGLRTYDIYNPFPEEYHRQAIAKLAVKHFAPTSLAKKSLLNEGINKNDILMTGNTVIDAVLLASKVLQDTPLKNLLIENHFSRLNEILQKNMSFVLVTLHRRENLGLNFLSISKSLLRMTEKYPKINFIVIEHPNPHVNLQIKKSLDCCKGIFLVPPVSYPEMVYLMKKCLFILTDSGGLQEEGPAFKKPVIVARSVTERKEGVLAGTIILGGVSEKPLFKIMSKLLDDFKYLSSFKKLKNPYGDGKASVRIVDNCLAMLEKL